MDSSIPKPAADLLDFISGPESHGNYNSVVGNPQNQPDWPYPPVSTMTITDLLAAQTQWVQDGRDSAAGRYQINQPTLLGLVKNISGTSLYDNDMQDRLGYQLLKGCGYAGYMAGTVSFDNFALALAKKWAGLPVLKDVTRPDGHVVKAGQSYYDGVGGNSAGVTPSQLTDVLHKAKPPISHPGTGYYGGDMCFLGSTLVHMADGTFLPIRNVEPGDMIRGVDHASRSHEAVTVVENRRTKHDNYLEITLSDDTLLHVSWGQEFALPGGGHVKASHLHIGQYLDNLDGAELRVAGLRMIPAAVEMYDLKTSDPRKTGYAVGIRLTIIKEKP